MMEEKIKQRILELQESIKHMSIQTIAQQGALVELKKILETDFGDISKEK